MSWLADMQEGAEVRHKGSEFNVKVMKQEVVVMEPAGRGSSVTVPPLACLFAKSRPARETCPANIPMPVNPDGASRCTFIPVHVLRLSRNFNSLLIYHVASLEFFPTLASDTFKFRETQPITSSLFPNSLNRIQRHPHALPQTASSYSISSHHPSPFHSRSHRCPRTLPYLQCLCPQG